MDNTGNLTPLDPYARPPTRYSSIKEETNDEEETIPEEDIAEEETTEEAPVAGQRLIATVPGKTSRAFERAGTATGGVLYKLGTELDSTVPKKRRSDDMADLLRGVSKNDPEVDFSDIVSVSEEDVYGDGGADMSDLMGGEDGEAMDDLFEVPDYMTDVPAIVIPDSLTSVSRSDISGMQDNRSSRPPQAVRRRTAPRRGVRYTPKSQPTTLGRTG